MLLNKYCGNRFEASITESWENLLAPEHVIKIEEEKAIVDLMLGIISMVSNAGTLEAYKIDMKGEEARHRLESKVFLSLLRDCQQLCTCKSSGNYHKDLEWQERKKKGKRL